MFFQRFFLVLAELFVQELFAGGFGLLFLLLGQSSSEIMLLRCNQDFLQLQNILILFLCRFGFLRKDRFGFY